MQRSRVSILIPTWNGVKALPALLDAIERQSRRPDEIVAVDSASTDGTPALLERRGVRVHAIAPAAFNHGATRNAGVTLTTGDLVILIVQDAVPVDGGWLDALTRPLDADPMIAGTFARQVPTEHAGALTRWSLAQWAAARPEPRIVGPLTQDEFDALAPMSRLDACAFDNVCSCIRRSVWNEHPFRSTPIAEDLEWAREVLLAGHRLVYAPTAVVIHSHDRPARYEFARTYLLHRRLYELFELRTIPTVRGLARAIATSAALHLRCERAVQGIPRALALAFAWPLGQYCGGLSAARGWRPLRSRTV
jgi:rhamnosyltransferase